MASSQTSLFDLGQATEKGNTTLLYLPLMWEVCRNKQSSHFALQSDYTTLGHRPCYCWSELVSANDYS
ncbi:hypothetical protein MTR67_035666 [Solanum verrucosum]|uniref:Uncharacterized protein n=1 Tax=Solanum verrucosum TaxID=315347 RepID=A0AAF0UB21_SOLVR|nr:hypothetical protein MTR67_035666 [Solanum verrucosum]